MTQGVSTDGKWVGKLERALYGTRDAPPERAAAVESCWRRHEEMASHPLSEDVKVSDIMDTCPKAIARSLEVDVP